MHAPLLLLLLLLSVSLALSVAAAATPLQPSTQQSFTRIDRDTLTFIDSAGRQRLFHGLCVDDNFDLPALSDQSLALMQQWGMNVVRLGIHWHLYETAPGVFDAAYLDGVDKLVRRLNAAGIYVVFDMHQDLWAPMYCGGHGIPDFYGQPPAQPEYGPGGKKQYPLPVAPPVYDDHGHLLDCANVSAGPLGWASSYVTYALGAAAQRLYDNDNGTADRFGVFWQAVAKRFASYPGVLGYELLNEPWLGDVPLSLAELDPLTNPKHWSLWFPGHADRVNMQPLYQRLHAAIRQVDDQHIIFFEPASGGNILGAFPVGYDVGPGGHAYDDRQALSYHVYCPMLQSDLPYNPGQKTLWDKLRTLLDLGVCDLLNEAQYQVRKDDTVRLGVGGFMTEFGSMPNETEAIDVLQLATRKMDEFLHSWTYWILVPDQQPSANIVRALARTYPQAVAGRMDLVLFEPTSGDFTLRYTACGNSSAPCSSTLTEIYVSSLYYGGGGSVPAVSIDPPSAARVVSFDASGSRVLVVENTQPGATVTVRVVKAQQ